MFKIVPKRTAWWPVTFKGVSEDGSIVTNSFQAQFELHDVDVLAQIYSERDQLDEAIAVEGENAPSLSAKLAAYAAKFVLNWKEVVEENEDPMPFTDENLRRVMGVPNAFQGTTDAYRDCLAGRAEARTGN